MTFDDFLDELNPDSEEYDTDLEDAFFKPEIEPPDARGSWYYERACKSKSKLHRGI